MVLHHIGVTEQSEYPGRQSKTMRAAMLDFTGQVRELNSMERVMTQGLTASDAIALHAS